jgi:iron(III) transport system permease protein
MTTLAHPSLFDSLVRRYREFRLIARDPVLLIGLLFIGAFIFAFIVFPLARVIWQGFFVGGGHPNEGQFSLQYFLYYLDPTFTTQYWSIFWWTIEMGVGAAIGSTIVGFLFAYTMVRCNIPFRRLVHALALVPTISPPFAIALAAILLFGRSGFVTKEILHIQFTPGVNDIYGLDGLIAVQIITFFPVAYLILRGLLERIDPSMEEAALSLGASKWHIFRSITLPLLTPGIAASFLLMFVESLADLGNPIFIGGNITVLSTQIWIAVNGEFNQQRRGPLADFVAANPHRIPSAAILGLAQVLHLGHRQADRRGRGLCQRASDTMDLYRLDVLGAAAGHCTLRGDLPRVDYQVVGH